MKEILKKHWLVLLIVSLIIGWFIWFQLRPAMIRSRCSRWPDIVTEGTYGLDRLDRFFGEKDRNRYRDCLHNYGLDK